MLARVAAGWVAEPSWHGLACPEDHCRVIRQYVVEESLWCRGRRTGVQQPRPQEEHPPPRQPRLPLPSVRRPPLPLPEEESLPLAAPLEGGDSQPAAHDQPATAAAAAPPLATTDRSGCYEHHPPPAPASQRSSEAGPFEPPPYEAAPKEAAKAVCRTVLPSNGRAT